MCCASGFAGQSRAQSTAFAVTVRTVTSAKRSLTRNTVNVPRDVGTLKREYPVGAFAGSIGTGVGVGAAVGAGALVGAAVGAAVGTGDGVTDGAGAATTTAGAAIFGVALQSLSERSAR